ncbi:MULTISPECIES: preprotein translocase subunit SecG [unclassified Nitratiruptor]|uniref:preprotein translocase subunit SecG n=1 Tax=unclassified Nitratiruptor TaxID=2624044 RepID=UPI0019169742|nr:MULTISPECIES: preprotein translocase subunit SecG [unclassified Nitratiruptor]BCD61122.1 preprotein translocase subunit SecG [Nitratiruptor sp. YY08-10]BCD65055.1 preprotein translocase subunit SecG [Nitratiruptor sp. YY08-14]
MIKVLFILQIVLAIILTIVILLQKSSSIGLGAYSGSNESVFGAKGPQGFLARLTFFLATVFVFNTILLGYLYNKNYTKSVVDTIKVQKTAPVPTIPAPVTKSQSNVPEAPAAK